MAHPVRDTCRQPPPEGWLSRGSQLGILSTATVSQCVIPHLCVGQPLQEGWLWRGSQLGILSEGEGERERRPRLQAGQHAQAGHTCVQRRHNHLKMPTV
jgi:hypothetical protein